MDIIKCNGSKSTRSALTSSALILPIAAGAASWPGLAQAAGEETGSHLILLEHYELMENGVVVFRLETGENLSLTADQYLIMKDGLLLITDELAQASVYSLSVMGSVRAQLLTDPEQVATIDATVTEATPAQTLSITEGEAPRLSEQVELQRYELAQKSECEDGSDDDDEGCALPVRASSEASGSEGPAAGMSVAVGAMALLGMPMISDKPEEEVAAPSPTPSPAPHPNAGTGGDVDALHPSADIYTAGGGKPSYLHSMDGKLYFTGWIEGSTHDMALFAYDPEIGVIQLIQDLNPSGGDSITEKHGLDGLLYFSGVDAPTSAWGIYVYNPNTGSTTLEQTFSSSPRYLEVLDSLLYFTVDDALHSYDPSSATFNALSSVSSASHLHAMAGKLYSSQVDGLYAYDPLMDSNVKISPIGSSDFTSYEGKLYFNGYDGSSYEMRVYDPTTGLVSDVVGANLSSTNTSPSELHALSGKIYFSGRDNTGNRELWAYEPDSDTSALAGDFIPGSSDLVKHLEDLDGILYFGSYLTESKELFAYFPDDLTV